MVLSIPNAFQPIDMEGFEAGPRVGLWGRIRTGAKGDLYSLWLGNSVFEGNLLEKAAALRSSLMPYPVQQLAHDSRPGAQVGPVAE